MTVNLYEREVKRVQKRFNETFGRQTVCNLTVRYASILSICRLGILSRKICEANDKEKVKGSIHSFIRIRDVLNDCFKLMEKQKKGGKRSKKKRYTIDRDKNTHVSTS